MSSTHKLWQEKLATNTELTIRGHASQSAFDYLDSGEIFALEEHNQIVQYEPSELFVRAQSGISLSHLKDTLKQNNQWVPELESGATSSSLGSFCSLNWPSSYHATYGTLQHAILGVSLGDGLGRALRFGGNVIKNVAGFDVSKILIGSTGIFGFLDEISIKVRPLPEVFEMRSRECEFTQAIAYWDRVRQTHSCVIRSGWMAGLLYSEFAGSASVVNKESSAFGGQRCEQPFWPIQDNLNNLEQDGEKLPLWQFSINPRTQQLPNTLAVDNLGATRYIASMLPENSIQALAQKYQGMAFCHNLDAKICYPRLSPQYVQQIQSLKKIFDPSHKINMQHFRELYLSS